MTDHPRADRVGFSAGRITTVAANTFTEAVRQRMFFFLLLVGVAVVASLVFFRQFDFGEQFKFVKDVGLGLISVFGSIIAVVAMAQVLPRELEHRTIYTVLAKPVRRIEFLLGKYLGCVLLLLVSVVLMAAMLAAELAIIERGAIAQIQRNGPENETQTVEQAVREVQTKTRDPALVKAVLLIQVKVALLAAVTLVFSTFSTSLVFNVTAGFMVWIAGVLVEPVKELLAGRTLVLAILAVIPDLSVFDVADEVVQGLGVSWPHVGAVALYGLGRIGLLLAAGYLIFSRREI